MSRVDVGCDPCSHCGDCKGDVQKRQRACRMAKRYVHKFAEDWIDVLVHVAADACLHRDVT